MPENEDKTVGRPFDPEAARKAQAKAVEARKRNAEKKAYNREYGKTRIRRKS